MKNAIARREYAPVEYLTLTLAAASSAFVEHLDHVPARLRREHPDLPAAEVSESVLRELYASEGGLPSAGGVGSDAGLAVGLSPLRCA